MSPLSLDNYFYLLRRLKFSLSPQALKPILAGSGCDNGWYQLAAPFPSLALVRIVELNDADKIRTAAKGMLRIISYLCDNCIPHNVFLTLGQSPNNGGQQCIRAIVYPRDGDALTKDKQLSGFNIACFESAGYVAVGSKYLTNFVRQTKCSPL